MDDSYALNTRTHRIAFYYQTFTQEHNCLRDMDQRVTDLYIASIHFGSDPVTKKPYMHLNDHPPSYFRKMLDDLDMLHHTCRVHLMIGGAGGGLAPLIYKSNIYMPMLQSFLRFNNRITGINIDVEEPNVSTEQVCVLLKSLNEKFRGYELSLSPIVSPASSESSSLADRTTTPPRFSLHEFGARPESKLVRTYLLQMYSNFNNEALEEFVEQHQLSYSSVLVGTLSNQFRDGLHLLQSLYTDILSEHPDLGGAFDWEMFDAPKGWVECIDNCHIQCLDDLEIDDWGVTDFCLLL